MVVIAAILPARGAGKDVLEIVVHAAIALLFFIYGAWISLQAIWTGILHWRLQSLVFVTAFVMFPLLGFGITRLAEGHLDGGLATRVMFVSLLPSTVQSSIAFTSIARGNVPAALCCPPLSNLAGVIITRLLATMLLSAGTGGMFLDTGRDIALQVLLPVVIGQFARPLIGEWSSRQKTLTMLVDRGSILLLMANIIFPASAVGLIVLPLMLFHQMQLMIWAALTRRYAQRPVEAVTTITVPA